MLLVKKSWCRPQSGEPLYRQVEQAFGERGAVELVSLCGYYSAVSFVINTFAVPPPGSSPQGR